MYVPHFETLIKEAENAAKHRCIPTAIHEYTSVDNIVFNALLTAELGRVYVSAYRGWVHIGKPYNLNVFYYDPKEGILECGIESKMIKNFVKSAEKKRKREFHSSEMNRDIDSYLGISPKTIVDLIERNKPDEETKKRIIIKLFPSMPRTLNTATSQSKI